MKLPVVRALVIFVFLILVSIIASADGSDRCIKTLAIVNGYSSGDNLADAFHAHVKTNYPDAQRQVVHIHASGEPHSHLAATFKPERYNADHSHGGDPYHTLGWLAQFKPNAIVPGSESGVLLADQLMTAANERHPEWGVPSNGIHEGRRDKLLMGEAVKNAGLMGVMQMATDNHQEALAWVKQKRLFPGTVVLKPRNSAGTDQVYFARSAAEVSYYFGKIKGSVNEYGIVNDTVLLQPYMKSARYIRDAEFVVNTVSRDGKHVVSDMWQYTKKPVKGAGEIYVVDRLIPFHGDIQKRLTEYVFKVLDALNIKTGWGHAEVKLTENGAEIIAKTQLGEIFVDIRNFGAQPVLIEIGNRMMGARQPLLVEKALGQSQLSLGIEAFISPELFMSRPVGYEMINHAAVVSINNNRMNVNASHRMEEQLRYLPGYQNHVFFFKEGEPAMRTVDMKTAIGYVWLVHPDEKTLEDSIKKVISWQNQGKFVSKP